MTSAFLVGQRVQIVGLEHHTSYFHNPLFGHVISPQTCHSIHERGLLESEGCDEIDLHVEIWKPKHYLYICFEPPEVPKYVRPID